MFRSGFAKTIGLVLVSIVVIAFVWYAANQPAVGWPSEDRRVVHPRGFSFVMPLGWEQHIALGDERGGGDRISLLPVKAVANPASINVSRIGTPPTEAGLVSRGYKAITFAGGPAYDKWSIHSGTRQHSRSIVFRRGDAWFDIVMRQPAIEPLDSGIWQKYAETFRVETVRALPKVIFDPTAAAAVSQPATQPLSLPAASSTTQSDPPPTPAAAP